LLAAWLLLEAAKTMVAAFACSTPTMAQGFEFLHEILGLIYSFVQADVQAASLACAGPKPHSPVDKLGGRNGG